MQTYMFIVCRPLQLQPEAEACQAPPVGSLSKCVGWPGMMTQAVHRACATLLRAISATSVDSIGRSTGQACGNPHKLNTLLVNQHCCTEEPLAVGYHGLQLFWAKSALSLSSSCPTTAGWMRVGPGLADHEHCQRHVLGLVSCSISSFSCKCLMRVSRLSFTLAAGSMVLTIIRDTSPLQPCLSHTGAVWLSEL